MGARSSRARAIAAYRKAIQIRPEVAKDYSALVLALKAQGKLDEVIASYREAIRLEPDNAVAHLNLGGILRARGDFAGSLALLRRGHELGSKQPGWPHPSRWWVAEAERRAALAERLTVVLKGESSPKDNAERLDLARMCFDTRRFAAAARFWAEAMEIDPKLGEAKSRSTDYMIYGDTVTRHHAACPAALAAVGQGEDDPRPDEAARNRLRAQARDWLRADLGLCSKSTIGGYARGYNVGGLRHLKECSDLAGIPGRHRSLQDPRSRAEAMAIALGGDRCPVRYHRDAMAQNELGNEAESQRMLDEGHRRIPLGDSTRSRSRR